MTAAQWVAGLVFMWVLVLMLLRRDLRRHDVWCACGSHRLGRTLEARHDHGIRHSREGCTS